MRQVGTVLLLAVMVTSGAESLAIAGGHTVFGQGSLLQGGDFSEWASYTGSVGQESLTDADAEKKSDTRSATFNTATYNIRFYGPPEEPNSWEQRRPHVANLIRFHDIAIWGSQEGKHNQLQHLRKDLGYDYIGVARDDGDTEGEYSAILFDPERFRALEEGTFWLSETPDRPSMSWETNYHRICTWGRFEHRDSGIIFYIYNAHFDHESQEARENSSRIVLEHIDEHVASDLPVLFMGDLNADTGNTAYNNVKNHTRLTDAYHITDITPHGPTGTFNGFDVTGNPDRRIDHIFVSGHFEVHRYGILTDMYDGPHYPSDHFPVMIETTLRH